jgi:hypothetical protein
MGGANTPNPTITVDAGAAGNFGVGDTNITSGNLIQAGNLTVTHNGSGTLGGEGTIGGTVNVNGILSPGGSIESLASGALTMNSGSTFVFEAVDNTTTGADQMAVDGALSLTDVTLDLTNAELYRIS